MRIKYRHVDIPKTSDNIQKWIAEQVGDAKSEGVVIGLSGGVDSALAAALCAGALGTDRVLGMILPCYSSEEDIEDALNIAGTLKIRYETAELTSTLDSLVKSLGSIGNKLVIGNIKSRLRMVSLYARSNQLNRLVCGTTNLTEDYIGYYTKYGDGGVDIEPIISLLKREVRDMATYMGIPSRIAARVPTAGLWPGQTDESELGFSYDELDSAVLFEEMGGGDYSAVGAGLEFPLITTEVLQKVRIMFDKSSHKRLMPKSCSRLSYLDERI